ncbi:hypothetical protein NYO99_12340 [Pelomonas sp. UHG3]|uniref:Uncharacterized protein n=1 Tax=Roseateles hydrophilus TaxID=2975054 RepID=A0ACC6CBX0_9BURK|nr:hypothetical protein [Pelomonas sp. UHG3]MCY4745764.1 hypothetical protein [Pelomonas sp. UHG3]
MNHSSMSCALAASLLALPVLAAPGAHGPNGEHLDAPTTTAAGGKASPRIEAQSELFEIVGTLAGGELSLLIDRFATNEPLLKAEVEVESGGLKAKAKFHADIGDFSVDDAALLKKLSTPGEHALVITVLAGDDTDLLDGVLRVTQAVSDADHAHGDDDHDHAHGTRWGRWALGGAAVAVALGGLAWRRRQGLRFGHNNDGGQA